MQPYFILFFYGYFSQYSYYYVSLFSSFSVFRIHFLLQLDLNSMCGLILCCFGKKIMKFLK